MIDPGDGGDYRPELDPQSPWSSSTTRTSRSLPGHAGDTKATRDGERNVIEVDVAHDARRHGHLDGHRSSTSPTSTARSREDTFDWYAQDPDGNVWYLGEDTQEFENGEPVSDEGSWEAGVDDALPGVVMLGRLSVTSTARSSWPVRPRTSATVSELSGATAHRRVR